MTDKAPLGCYRLSILFSLFLFKIFHDAHSTQDPNFKSSKDILQSVPTIWHPLLQINIWSLKTISDLTIVKVTISPGIVSKTRSLIDVLLHRNIHSSL